LRAPEFQVVIIASLGPLLWSGNFVVARVLHETIDPFQLNYLRWVVAGVILLPFTVRNWPQIAAAWASHPLQMLLLGLMSVSLFNWLVYAGLHHASASTGGAIFALSAVLILFISRLWRGDALRPRDLCGAAAAFLGAGLVVQQDVGDLLGARDMVGPLLLLGGAVVWAVYTVAVKRWDVPLEPTAALATTVFSGLLIMTPVAVIVGMPGADVLTEPEILWGLLYLGVGASVMAFVAWQASIARIGAARTGPFLHLVPVFTVALGVALAGETLTAQKAAGVVLVLLGVAIGRTGHSGRAAAEKTAAAGDVPGAARGAQATRSPRDNRAATGL
jgi:drug/metabolite transporter (DMT)-like permease